MAGQSQGSQGEKESRGQAVGWEYIDPLPWDINTEEFEDSKFGFGSPVIM